MPGLQAALPTGDIEGCADANTQVITVTSITDDFEAYCTFALESKPELCAARTACQGAQHGKAAELSTACAARGRGAPRGGGAWLAARVQTGEKRGRNGGLSTP